MLEPLTRRGDLAVTEQLVRRWQTQMDEMVASGEIAAATARTYGEGMKRFLAYLRAEKLVQGDESALRGWMATMRLAGRKPAGVQTNMAGVRAFYHWAAREKAIKTDPTEYVRGGQRKPRRGHTRQPLTDEEMRHLLATAGTTTVREKRDRAMLYVMAYTGIRSVEAQRARVGDVRRRPLRLLIWGKGHAEADDQVYLVQEDLVEALEAWLAVHPRGRDPRAALFCGVREGQPLGMRSVRGIMKGLLRAAGIDDPNKSTHSLRHTVLVNLIRQGVPPVRIMSLTRHRSLDALQWYVHDVERETDPVEGHIDYRREMP